MARTRDTAIPCPGRFGRREAPRVRFRRSHGSRRFRFRPWLLLWLPLLLCVVLAVLRLGSGQVPGLPTAEAIREGPVWEAGTLGGPARVLDGDTLKIGGTRIRIDGIDAPESGQICQRGGRPWRCGDAATAQMDSLVGGRDVTCEDRGTDRYGRTIGLCRAGGRDLGSAMVRAGLAMAYTHFSERYVPEERQARAARRGLWSSDFETPSAWRWGR